MDGITDVKVFDIECEESVMGVDITLYQCVGQAVGGVVQVQVQVVFQMVFSLYARGRFYCSLRT